MAHAKSDAIVEAERGAGFLLAPVLICGGAIGYFGLPVEPDLSALLFGAAILAITAFLVRSNAIPRMLLVGLLLILAGMLSAKFETSRAATKVVGGDISTRLTGRVETVEHRENGRVRLTLRVLSTAKPKLRYQPDRVRITARAIPEGLQPGCVVEGVARLLPPLGALRPDSYDFAFASYFDRVGASGFFLRPPELVPSPQSPGAIEAIAAAIERARGDLAARIRGHIGGAEGEIAAALVAGVRAGIPEEANEALRITGLAHVLSISGLHMALVAGVVIASLRMVFALFPGFASRHPARKYAAVLALVALSLYLLISGAAVAAQRSYIMIAVMLVALLFDRAALTMRNLAISALVILAIAPHEAAGPSFQMSFAATAALIAAYAWWSARRHDVSGGPIRSGGLARRIARFVALNATALAATSLIAGAATGIFGAWHFQRVSPLGIVANLAAMPIVSLIVMPFAVVGMVLMPLDLDGWAFAMMGKGLSWMLAVTSWLAERSPLDAIGAVPANAVLLLSVALVPLTVATTATMRMLCLPFLAGGIVLIGLRDLPQVYVSEDARLIGVRTSDGALAVNRARPNAFTVEDWSRAMMADRTVKPQTGLLNFGDLSLSQTTETSKGPKGGASTSLAREATADGKLQPTSAMEVVPHSAEPGKTAGQKPTRQARPDRGSRDNSPHASTSLAGFVCRESLCAARHAGGALIAHAETMAAAAPACHSAALIVIADPTAGNPCPNSRAIVLTARRLALRGAAEIAFDASGNAEVRYAIGESLRPWHDHRRFSRTARGLAPYKRPDKPANVSPVSISGSTPPAGPGP